MLSNAAAGRRLFARTREQGGQCAITTEDVQHRLENIITGLTKQLVKALRLQNKAVAAAKAAQIEAVHAAAAVAAGAKMTGVDLGVFSPAEAVCLMPPWLRSGREDASQLLVSLLLEMRAVGQESNGMRDVLPCTIPPSTIVVLGNTGAGKSTLLNAFLGEVSLLPTNAMRACTASIIEIEYNVQQTPGNEYNAEVEYLSAADWEREVKEAFSLVEAANSGSPFQVVCVDLSVLTCLF